MAMQSVIAFAAVVLEVVALAVAATYRMCKAASSESAVEISDTNVRTYTPVSPV